MNTIMLIFHITGGTIGILSGMAALFSRKGSRLHLKIGNVFFYSIMGMALSATYLAIFSAPSWINTIAGILTFYMVVTARRTATNRSGKSGIIEFAGAIYILVVLVVLIVLSIDVSKTGPKEDGVYAETYYMFTVVAVLAFTLDVKVIFKGGAYGVQRIARHLWRMCYALFVATSSLFLGQPQVFPEPINDSLILSMPVIAVVLMLFFWLIRVWFVARFRLAPDRNKVQSSPHET